MLASSIVLTIDGDSKTIGITLEGAAKALMSVIVGRIRSLITEKHGDDTLPVATQVAGERGAEMQENPRLAQLLTCVVPPAWDSRNDIMLQLAHMLIWQWR